MHLARLLRPVIFTLVLGTALPPLEGQSIYDTFYGTNGVALKPDFIGCIGCDMARFETDQVVLADNCRIHAFKNDGQVETEFGSNGVVEIPDCISGTIPLDHSLAIQNNSKIVFTNGSSIYRLNNDGTADGDFGEMGKAEIPLLLYQNIPCGFYAVSVDVRPNGKIVLSGGLAWVYVFPAVVQLNDDGSVDTGFGADGISILTNSGGVFLASNIPRLLLQPDGKILVRAAVPGGSGSDSKLGLIRLNADGSFDATFGNAGVETAIPPTYALVDYCLSPEGDILALLSVGNEYKISKILSSGSLDITFGSNGFAALDLQGGIRDASSIALQSNGRILVAATKRHPTFSDYLGAVLYRFTSEGVSDGTLGPGGRVILTEGGLRQGIHLLTLSDQDILLNGSGITNTGTQLTAIALAKLNSDYVSGQVEQTSLSSSFSVSPNPFAGGLLTLKGPFAAEGVVRVYLTDVLCRQVAWPEIISSGDSTVELMLPTSLSAGIYGLFVETRAGGTRQTALIVK